MQLLVPTDSANKKTNIHGYIVNYERWVNGTFVSWGNCAAERDTDATALEFLDGLRQLLADTHGFDKKEVRIVGIFPV